jgi:hypothetical protein
MEQKTFETQFEKDLRKLTKVKTHTAFQELHSEVETSIHNYRFDQTIEKSHLSVEAKKSLLATKQAAVMGYYQELEYISQVNGRALAEKYIAGVRKDIAEAPQKIDELYQSVLDALDIAFSAAQELTGFQDGLTRSSSAFTRIGILFNGISIPVEYSPTLPGVNGRQLKQEMINQDGKDWQIVARIIFDKALREKSDGIPLGEKPKKYKKFVPSDYGLPEEA